MLSTLPLELTLAVAMAGCWARKDELGIGRVLEVAEQSLGGCQMRDAQSGVVSAECSYMDLYSSKLASKSAASETASSLMMQWRTAELASSIRKRVRIVSI